MVHEDYNAQGYYTFLENLDFYRKADACQRSTKEYRLHGHNEFKFKYKHFFSDGIFSISYLRKESPVIKFKGVASQHLFTSEHQQQLLTTGHPALPARFSTIQEICKLFRFHPCDKDERMIAFEYSLNHRDKNLMNNAVAQAIILWDLITYEIIQRPDYTPPRHYDSDDGSHSSDQGSDDLPLDPLW